MTITDQKKAILVLTGKNGFLHIKKTFIFLGKTIYKQKKYYTIRMVIK